MGLITQLWEIGYFKTLKKLGRFERLGSRAFSNDRKDDVTPQGWGKSP